MPIKPFIPPSGPHAPRYKVGEEIGCIEITEYFNHGCRKPETLIHLTKPQHWYRIKCGLCGATEVVNQGQLLKGKERCNSCANESRGRAVSQARRGQVNLPADVEQALRRKW